MSELSLKRFLGEKYIDNQQIMHIKKRGREEKGDPGGGGGCGIGNYGEVRFEGEAGCMKCNCRTKHKFSKRHEN